MALPVSGPLSINDIVGEFGGTAPHSLSEYYRGGGLVPNIAANSSIPTSGTISIGNFYGAQNALWVTTLTSQEVIITDPFGPTITWVGYDTIDIPMGSLSDDTVDFYGGAQCKMLKTSDSGGAVSLYFYVAGTQVNSGWTTMTIGSYGSFNRTAASYGISGGNTYWYWASVGSHLTGGVNYTVTFV